MNFSLLGGAVFALLTLSFSGPSEAQKMYRCGSVYQDRPCEGAQPGKEVRAFDTPTTSATKADAASTDSQCKQRGIDSQKVVWARQSGVLSDKLIAEARTQDNRDLIADVYRMPRNSAPEVGAAIEAECVAAKKQAAAALAAALDAQGVIQPANRTLSTEMPASTRGTDSSTRSNIADDKKANCSSFASKLEDIQKSQRGGGNVAVMDSLSRRRIQLDAERSRAGC